MFPICFVRYNLNITFLTQTKIYFFFFLTTATNTALINSRLTIIYCLTAHGT